MPMPGTCRVCGCTETTPCFIRDGSAGVTFAEARDNPLLTIGAMPCSWADETQTLYTAPGCLAAAASEVPA